VGLARATVDRKVQRDDVLDAEEGERAMGIARLVGQAQTMVEESGDPRGFDAGRWLASLVEMTAGAPSAHVAEPSLTSGHFGPQA
jgi:hypothetical protein